MSDDFKYQCRRRSTRQYPLVKEAIVKGEELLGAGSGGDEGDGFKDDYCDGRHMIGGAEVFVTAMGSDGPEGVSPLISILAGATDPDGKITVRGSAGVRITSGPSSQPKSHNPDIDGLEMQTGDTQTISIFRGMDENPAQGRMVFENQGIGIQANEGGVWIRSLTKIKFMVAGATSYIELTPSGIVMKGPLIQIN